MAMVDRSIDDAETFESEHNPAAQREYERGLDHHRENRLDEAAKAYVRAIEIDPHHGQALNNLGVSLRTQGLLPAALAAYDRALALSPDDPSLLGNRGNVLRALGRYEEALVALHLAVRQAPNIAGLHQNLGLVLRDLGHLREAIICFDRSLALRPNHAGTRKDKAVALLAEGNFLKGFKELKAAAETEETRARFARIPEWHGTSLSGQTILVHSARDPVYTIQFARFLPRLKAKGARLLLECPRAMHGLMASADGIDELLEPGSETWGIDQQVSLLSLPNLAGTTRNHVPAPVPYLSAPRHAGFQLRHPETAKLTIGIAWQESGRGGGARTVGLEPFFALFGRPNTAVYSLQRGPAAGDLQRLGATGLVHNLGSLMSGLDDVARVIEQLDLVICADCLTAHLAGALGKPVWLVLPSVADWQWLLDRDVSSWYPTMRLFRQAMGGDWSAPFAELVQQLDSRLI